MGTVSLTRLLSEESASEGPAAEKRIRAGGRSARSRENTRERLLEAAVEVFVTKGLKRVTVDDLTKAAGFTRGAFYSNFESVDEVFFEVFRASARALLGRARARVELAHEIDLDFVADLMQAMSADRDWLVLQSEFTLLALRDDAARELLNETSGQLRSELAEMILVVLDRLGRRPVLAVDQLAQVVVGLQHQLATAGALGHLDDGDAASNGERNQRLVRQVLVALLTEFSEPLPV